MSLNKFYTISWTDLADASFNKELEFIKLKWNTKQVLKFIDLVDDVLSNLESGILDGEISKSTGIRRLVISKQTTIFYKVNDKASQINILLFWNNKNDPRKLKEMINTFK